MLYVSMLTFLILKLCVCMLGPLTGPQQLRVEEQQDYGLRNYRYVDSLVGSERNYLNSSEDLIHLKISWKASFCH